MTAWTRRALLQTLGVIPAAAACGANGNRTGRTAAPTFSTDDLRRRLRAVVAGLVTRFPDARGRLRSERRILAHVDAGGRGVDAETAVTAAFAWTDGAKLVQWSTFDVTERGLAEVLAIAGAQPAGPGDFGAPVEYRRGDDHTRDLPAQWLTPLARTYQRVRGRGGSRVVYRRAFVHAHTVDELHVHAGLDARQKISRVRTGVAFVGATGTATYTELAERAGTRPQAELDVPDAALSAAADDALALLTARPITPRDVDLLLDPSATAALVYGCVAPALATGPSRAGQMVAPPIVSVVDDPLLDGGYGSYDLDAAGRRAQAAPLVERGAVGDGGRRRPSNLVVAPGDASTADLIAEVKDGVLLEGGMAARVEPGRWTATLRVARAREIAGGKLTGRLYGPVLVRGPVPALLGDVRAASSEREHRAVDTGVAVDAPAWLTRGKVVAG